MRGPALAGSGATPPLPFDSLVRLPWWYCEGDASCEGHGYRPFSNSTLVELLPNLVAHGILPYEHV